MNNPAGAIDIDGLWTQTANGWTSDNAQEAGDYLKALQVASDNGGTVQFVNGTGIDNEAFRMVSNGGRRNLAQIFYNSDGKKAKPMNGAPIISTPNTGNANNAVNLSTNTRGAFNINDAKQGLRAVYSAYGRDMATLIERIYRVETYHFRSGQYKNTGTGGMEAHGPGPYYGYSPSDWFKQRSDYRPTGLWSAHEGPGLSSLGGNKQVKDRKKGFVVMPSVEAGMMFFVDYVQRYNGNYARWYSTEPGKQAIYRNTITHTTPTIVNSIASEQ
jgi:hypothetical protein